MTAPGKPIGLPAARTGVGAAKAVPKPGLQARNPNLSASQKQAVRQRLQQLQGGTRTTVPSAAAVQRPSRPAGMNPKPRIDVAKPMPANQNMAPAAKQRQVIERLARINQQQQAKKVRERKLLEQRRRDRAAETKRRAEAERRLMHAITKGGFASQPPSGGGGGQQSAAVAGGGGKPPAGLTDTFNRATRRGTGKAEFNKQAPPVPRGSKGVAVKDFGNAARRGSPAQSQSKTPRPGNPNPSQSGKPTPSRPQISLRAFERIHQANPAPRRNGPPGPANVRERVDIQTGNQRLRQLDAEVRRRNGQAPTPPRPPLGSRLPGDVGDPANKGKLRPEFNGAAKQ